MAKVVSFAQSKALLDRIKSFQDAGWRVKKSPGFEGISGGPVAYYCHVEEGALLVVSYLKESFALLETFLRKEAIPFKGICSIAGELIEQMTKEYPAVSEETSELLGIAGGLYLLGTQTYRTTRDIPGVQYLVLRYWDFSENMPLLRPNPLVYADPLTPDQVNFFANQVLLHDRKVHPERFSRASVLSFKTKKH